MDSAVIQLIILGAIALFMILRLRNVLGTRDGFEPSKEAMHSATAKANSHGLEVIEGGIDRDIVDHADGNSDITNALAEMKKVEPEFSVSEFLGGSRQAYEMILMAFEGDDLETLGQFLSKDVFDGFAAVIDERQDKGLKVEATFVGVRELKIIDASFDPATNAAEITMHFTGELTSVVKDAKGRIVEGDANAVKRQKDHWTFARTMGSNDPNWELVETGA